MRRDKEEKLIADATMRRSREHKLILEAKERWQTEQSGVGKASKFISRKQNRMVSLSKTMVGVSEELERR